MTTVVPIDQTLRCVDCHSDFLYSAYEFGRFGKLHSPRCSSCRAPRESDDATTDQPSSGAAFTDVSKVCVVCNQAFVWTADDQTYFVQHDLQYPPRRCIPCRKVRRVARQREQR